MIKSMEIRKYGIIEQFQSSVWPENSVYKRKIIENKVGKLV